MEENLKLGSACLEEDLSMDWLVLDQLTSPVYSVILVVEASICISAALVRVSESFSFFEPIWGCDNSPK